MSDQERNTIVDEKDNPIGCKPRSEILPTDIFRGTSLILVDKDFRLLLAKRSQNKKKSPGLWAPTVNGTVECDETYIENITKETQEEIGHSVETKKIIELCKFFTAPNDPPRRHFAQYYIAVVSVEEVGTFAPDSAEISELKWWSLGEIISTSSQRPAEFLDVFRVGTKEWQIFVEAFTQFKQSYERNKQTKNSTIVTIVDENDQEIGSKNRADLAYDDIYRTVAVVFFDVDGRMLLAKRSLTKRSSPGAWMPTVAGTVEPGETYLLNALKEAEEEVGLKLTENGLIVGPNFLSARKSRSFTQYFFWQIDPNHVSDLTPDPAEITELRWWTVADFETFASADENAHLVPGSLATKERRDIVFHALQELTKK